jgi:drug/metabolite transporter (DMT)-like permease|tara:strand:- start:1772 stop:2620 length:849 start_codon:yes stop_codon:yes gene_type:complete
VNFKNFLLAFVTSSIWGSSFLMIKYSLEELNPSDIAIYRILIGALFINIFVRAKENIVKTDNIKIFIISFFWMALPFYMFGIAEQTITSSLAGLINGSTPIFVAFIAVVFYKLKVTKIQLLYIFTGFIGVGLISLSGGINEVSFEIGFLYALIASISYGIAVNMVEPLIQKYDSLIVIKMVIRYAFLISLIMLGPTASFKLPTVEVSLIPMLILGIGGTGIAFLTYYKLLESVGRISSSFVVYMIPIFSIFFGYQFLNEITNSIQFIGIGVILSSAFLYSRT